MKVFVFGSPDEQEEKERAIQTASKLGAIDKDAHVRTAPSNEPAGLAVDARPAIPPADTSEAAERLRELLETLGPEDVHRLLEQEEARRRAIAEQEEKKRQELLLAEEERRRRERNAKLRAELEPQLGDVEMEIAELMRQYNEVRAQLLTIASAINDAVDRHRRLYDRLLTTLDRPPGELAPSWPRPHRWEERHAITLRELQWARVEEHE
jgi:small-conductance mechanosensitive channel